MTTKSAFPALGAPMSPEDSASVAKAVTRWMPVKKGVQNGPITRRGNATPETHGPVRDMFKPVSLAVN
jgi:hypothetical protein